MERLLTFFTPHHYQLDLEVNRTAETISGTVQITGAPHANPIKLHAHELQITSVSLSATHQLTQTCDFTYDELRSLRVTERFDPKTGKAVFAGRFPDSPIGYQIPSLEEEFYQVQGLNKSTGNNVGVYVEVKEPDFFMNQGLDILKATIDTLTKFGYNSPDSKAILQIFDYEAVVRSRELGWKGQLCMLITAGGQGAKDDKARHAWLTTPEGIKEVAKYATIYAPNFNLLAVPNADGKGYTLSKIGDLARENGMKLHSWTLRKDSLPAGFKDFNEVLDVSFKQLKVDGMFSDFPDLLVQYLKANNLR